MPTHRGRTVVVEQNGQKRGVQHQTRRAEIGTRSKEDGIERNGNGAGRKAAAKTSSLEWRINPRPSMHLQVVLPLLSRPGTKAGAGEGRSISFTCLLVGNGREGHAVYSWQCCRVVVRWLTLVFCACVVVLRTDQWTTLPPASSENEFVSACPSLAPAPLCPPPLLRLLSVTGRWSCVRLHGCFVHDG
jgi:hypothetical protein